MKTGIFGLRNSGSINYEFQNDGNVWSILQKMSY